MDARLQSLARVRSYLAESAEIKRLTAEACAEAIATAAGVITTPSGRAASCSSAATAGAPPIASTWRPSSSAG